MQSGQACLLKGLYPFKRTPTKLVVKRVFVPTRPLNRVQAKDPAMMAAVASGALWVRLTTTVATGYDLPFDTVYSCAAWLGWLVPLAVVTLLPTPWAPSPRQVAHR